MIKFEGAASIVKEALFAKEGKEAKALNGVELAIIKGACEGKTYQAIADSYSCSVQNLRNEGCKLWRRVGAAFGEKVTMRNFTSIVEIKLSQKLTEKRGQSSLLAEQLKALFEALNYQFEDERWEKNFFEWVIQVPMGLSSSLVLVRGIEGEVGINDVETFRQSINQQKTSQGWLVTSSRISKLACQDIKKSQVPRLLCYTFDMLLDEVINFSKYIEWLKTEVKSRKIDRMYVPLACIKDEFNPDNKQKIGVSRYDENDGWIDGYVDIWLYDAAKGHLSILGEFGTGKTWFSLHYAWVCLQRYLDARKRGVQRPRLPLVITLRDYARALDVENVLASFFFQKHKISSNIKVFDLLNRMGKLLMIFDGFDEMAAKVDRQKMINNFWELAKVIVPGAKAILTCRTEHFPEAQQSRAMLNAELKASTANLTLETPQFEVLELEKFDDEQIRRVLSLRTNTLTVDTVMGNPQLLDLARRPVMTELILEALPDIEAGKPVDMSRVYLYAVRQKMERDITAERTFTSLADKLYFLCELSWEMLSTDQMSLNYRLFPDRIRRLFSSVVQEEKDLDHWHYDMMGQTMLIRNADGDYTPAHRSLLEFFVALKFAAELGVLPDDFTELAQARSDLSSSAAPVDYTWSNYFVCQLDKTGRIVKIPPLKEFKSESFDNLRETFGKAPLTKAIIDLLLPILNYDEKKSVIDTSLINAITATRNKSEYEVGYVGGNAATLLLKMDRSALKGKDFSHTVIKGVDFTEANLCDTNFYHANLPDCVFPKILGHIYAVAFSPDEKLLAMGDSNGTVHLLEVASGKEIWAKTLIIDRVSSLCFNPDGTTLAIGGADSTIYLYTTNSGECSHTLQGHKNWVNSVAFSPDGTKFASGSDDYTVKLWDIKTAECLYTLQEHTAQVNTVAFSPDGLTLASGGDYTVRLWDIRTAKCLYTLQKHTAQVKTVAFSPDGLTLASGSDDNTVRLWDIRTAKCLYTLQEHAAQVKTVAFSPDGLTLASGSDDNTVQLWNIKSGELKIILQGHTSWVGSIAFSANGATLASGSGDNTVRLWHVNSGECRNIFQGDTSGVNSVAFSPDGSILASGSNDCIIRLWNVESGKCFQTLQGHAEEINSVAFNSDGTILASAGDNTVRLWNIGINKPCKILRGHTGWVGSVAFNPDGVTIVSGGKDNTVRLWNVNSGECRKILLGHTSWVGSVASSPDGTMFASGSEDSTVRLWNANSGECCKILQEKTIWVNSVTFSSDSTTFACGGSDNIVQLWDVNSGECCKILQGHTSWIWSLAFSPSGKTLASGGQDCTVRLWDIKDGICIYILEEHNSRVNSLAFSPDGETLASASTDGTIKFWCMKTGNCLKTIINQRPCERLNITGVQGLTSAEITSLKTLGASSK
ncbi:WD-40 repeat protein (plasmid) [Calothrix sp. PCC 7716]|nr:WD-40 repeat protein [Calothrix sp. PCC 7716]